MRYALGTVAAILAAVGVHQALRVPPLKDIEIRIRGLAPQFDGYTLLQLTDLHISRLFTAKWARAVVERANGLGANLIVVTGDLIDGSLASRRADVDPLRDLRAADGVYVIPGNHEYFLRCARAVCCSVFIRRVLSAARNYNQDIPLSLRSCVVAPVYQEVTSLDLAAG
jgi:predicted MPP superfamily phosphohydrolase